VADGAIEALKLAGLPTDGLYPKTVEAVMDQDIDLVVSVCDNAKELPDLPAPGEAHPRGLPRPPRRAAGELHRVRDDIRARLVPAFASPGL
jgi:arsenate reductase